MTDPLQAAARRSAAEQRERQAAIPSPLFVGVVSSVAAGAAADGVHDTVTVSWKDGDSLAASYADGITFTRGDVVLCALFNQQLRILSRQVGFP